MSSKIPATLRLVRCPKCRKVLPEPPDVPVYKCGSCDAVLQAKKRKNDTVDTTPPKPEEDSSGKRKMEQVSDDQKPSSSSSTNHSMNEPDPKTNDHISSELPSQEQDATKKSEICTVDAASNGIKEYSSGKQKMPMEQLSNDQEACSSSNYQSVVSSIDESHRNNNDCNDPRSSTELSGHGDPESSPEATTRNIKQEKEQQDAAKNRSRSSSTSTSSSTSASPEAVVHDPINEAELTMSPEIEKPSRKPNSDRDSTWGSKSNFKSMIAEKLLDPRQKKVVSMDEEEDILSEDGSADLFHRRRFNRISSEETLDNATFGGKAYEYEGSVSSFDGNDNQIEYHQDHRRVSHPSKPRRSKDDHRSTEFQPFYGNPIPPRHRPPVIPGNAKMERLELLKMVRQLQDQLERTNVSNSAQLYDHDLNHAGRYGRRMAFSGETVAVNRILDGGSGMCHRCHPQDRHFSAQLLSRPHICCHVPHHVPSTCYSSESDFSAAPAPVMIIPEPKPKRKPYDSSPKKRYVRPISGGSPWITCYRCSEVLQLPQSFLVFKKKCHSLRCGACQKVLNFMVSDGTHVHRYYPEEMIAAPPSSEVEDYGDARAGPVSCSDRSFQKSYSTETDRNGSREFGEERRKARMSRDTSGSTQPSSSRASGRRKVISEIEEVEPANNGSPLHWLMGYASPSKVIRG